MRMCVIITKKQNSIEYCNLRQKYEYIKTYIPFTTKAPSSLLLIVMLMMCGVSEYVCK